MGPSSRSQLAERNIFLTGATGFLGGQIAYDLLTTTAARVHCLARAQADQSAVARVLSRLRRIARTLGRSEAEAHAEVDAQLGVRLSVHDGDIVRPMLGLSERVHGELAVDEIWHVAASVDFLPARRRQTFEANVDGTKAMLRFADARNVRCFNYVSTAFVAGEQRGTIFEGPADASWPPNNPYEESKRVAEDLLLQHHARTGMAHRILRPTVIVGDSRSHEPESSAALYGFLSILLHLRQSVDAIRDVDFDRTPMCLLTESGGKLNLICVDHASGLIIDLASQQSSVNQIFHIGAIEPTPLSHLADAVAASKGWNIRLVDTPSALRPSDVIVQRWTKRFNCYLFNSKSFDLSNGMKCVDFSRARLTPQDLRGLCAKFFASHDNLLSRASRTGTEEAKLVASRA
jgi:nucleoside-diphosphate-sugar epimerase